MPTRRDAFIGAAATRPGRPSGALTQKFVREDRPADAGDHEYPEEPRSGSGGSKGRPPARPPEPDLMAPPIHFIVLPFLPGCRRGVASRAILEEAISGSQTPGSRCGAGSTAPFMARTPRVPPGRRLPNAPYSCGGEPSGRQSEPSGRIR